MSEARYSPKVGSLPHRVLTFMVLNPEEELTRSDIATKFDAGHSSIDALLALPVNRGVLKRGRNSDRELVWSLGESTNFLLDQAPGGESPPTKLPARCYTATSGADQSEEESYIDRSLSARGSRPSPFPTAPPVYLNLGNIAVRKGVKLQTKEERRRAEFAEWFAQFEVGDSAEFEEMHLPTLKLECSRHTRLTGAKFRFAETGGGLHGLERIA